MSFHPRRLTLVLAASAGLDAAGAATLSFVRSGRPRPGSPHHHISATARASRNAAMAKLAGQVGASTATHRARRVFASAARREALDADMQLKAAEQVAGTLGNMKGALMKLGQLASFLDDAMPEPVREALAQLQQDAPMSAELAADVVESELGAPPPSTAMGEAEARWWRATHAGTGTGAGAERAPSATAGP